MQRRGRQGCSAGRSRVAVYIHHGHASPGSGKGTADGPAYAAAASGHYGDALFESSGHCALSPSVR